MSLQSWRYKGRVGRVSTPLQKAEQRGRSNTEKGKRNEVIMINSKKGDSLLWNLCPWRKREFISPELKRSLKMISPQIPQYYRWESGVQKEKRILSKVTQLSSSRARLKPQVAAYQPLSYYTSFCFFPVSLTFKHKPDSIKKKKSAGTFWKRIANKLGAHPPGNC